MGWHGGARPLQLSLAPLACERCLLSQCPYVAWVAQWRSPRALLQCCRARAATNLAFLNLLEGTPSALDAAAKYTDMALQADRWGEVGAGEGEGEGAADERGGGVVASWSSHTAQHGSGPSTSNCTHTPQPTQRLCSSGY